MDKGNNFNEAVLAIYNEQGGDEAVQFMVRRGYTQSDANQLLEKLTNPVEEKLEDVNEVLEDEEITDAASEGLEVPESEVTSEVTSSKDSFLGDSSQDGESEDIDNEESKNETN